MLDLINNDCPTFAVTGPDIFFQTGKATVTPRFFPCTAFILHKSVVCIISYRLSFSLVGAAARVFV